MRKEALTYPAIAVVLAVLTLLVAAVIDWLQEACCGIVSDYWVEIALTAYVASWVIRTMDHYYPRVKVGKNVSKILRLWPKTQNVEEEHDAQDVAWKGFLPLEILFASVLALMGIWGL